MNKILIAGLLLILSINFCYSQDLEERKIKQIEFAEKLLFEGGKNIFKEEYVYEQIPLDELSQRKEYGEDIDLESASGTGKMTISKFTYDFFKKNPDIEFKNIIHEDLVEVYNTKGENNDFYNKLKTKYIVLKSSGPIENCYIYKPKYSINKEFELKL